MLELTAQIRKKEKAGALRRENNIPAVLYGHKLDNVHLSVDYKNFAGAYREVGESTILKLKFDNQKRNVLIHDVDTDPVTDKFIHVDFYQVKMDEKITVTVPLVFAGESSLIKDEGGILVKNLHEVEVEALPADLPHEIETDISAFKTFEDRLYIKDLVLPDKVKILAEPDEIVAVIAPPRSEEELAALEEKPEEKVEEVAVAEKAKPEEAAEETAASKE